MDNSSKIRTQREGLAKRIAALNPPHPLRVAIDGITAAGKTTFADELAPMIQALGRPVVRATIDGYHNPRDVRYRNGSETPESYYNDSFNYSVLRSRLLIPLRDVRTEPRVLPIAAYDYRTESETTDRKAEFTPDAVLLFDGVMLFREEINDCWDFRIYMDTRMETALVRGVSRDAETEAEQTVVGKKYLNRYFPGQRMYQARARPTEIADVIVLNTDLNASHIHYNRD